MGLKMPNFKNLKTFKNINLKTSRAFNALQALDVKRLYMGFLRLRAVSAHSAALRHRSSPDYCPVTQKVLEDKAMSLTVKYYSVMADLSNKVQITKITNEKVSVV